MRLFKISQATVWCTPKIHRTISHLCNLDSKWFWGGIKVVQSSKLISYLSDYGSKVFNLVQTPRGHRTISHKLNPNTSGLIKAVQSSQMKIILNLCDYGLKVFKEVRSEKKVCWEQCSQKDRRDRSLTGTATAIQPGSLPWLEAHISFIKMCQTGNLDQYGNNMTHSQGS